MIEHTVRILQTTPIDTELRIIYCVHYEDNVHSINALLKTSSTNELSPICTYISQLVKLVGSAIPILMPYKRNSKESSIDRIMCVVINTNQTESSNVPIIIQTFFFTTPYDTICETICKLS